MKIIQLIILSISLLTSASSYAHAGHDHTSTFASLVHLFWLVPILIAAAILYSKLLQKNYKIKNTHNKIKGKS